MEDQDSTVKDTLKKIIGDKKDGGIPINEKGKWLDKKRDCEKKSVNKILL